MEYTYDVNGSQTYWYFADGVSRPSAETIDNDISWGQPWTNNGIFVWRGQRHVCVF